MQQSCLLIAWYEELRLSLRGIFDFLLLQGIEIVFGAFSRGCMLSFSEVLANYSCSRSSGFFQSKKFWYLPWSHPNKSINSMQKKLLEVDRNSIPDYHQAAPVPPLCIQKCFYNFLCAIAFLEINSMQKEFLSPLSFRLTVKLSESFHNAKCWLWG